MFRTIMIGSLILVCLTWSRSLPIAQAVVYDASNFSADGRKYQPVPSGHVPGKDNGPGVGTHNSGEDCGICHTPGGKAGNNVLTIGGTIYEDRAARKPLKGAEVILQDISGNVFSMTTNQVGNFWTTAPIASNPCTVASHSGVTDIWYTLDAGGNCVSKLPSSDSRAWQYKAWIKYGDHVRQMVTIAPVGGSTGAVPRMSCNMHHSPMGSTGAVWGMQKNTLRGYPAANLSFKKHVLPIFRNKCAPCHIPGTTKTRLVTRSDVDATATGSITSIDYSGGRDYTSYAGSNVGSANVPKPGISNLATGYAANPDASPLLLYTLMQTGGTVIHGGGGFWTATDGDYRAIRQWIAEGAANN